MTLSAWLFALGLTVPVAGLALLIGRKGAHAASYWTAALVFIASPLALALILSWIAKAAPEALEPLGPVIAAAAELPDPLLVAPPAAEARQSVVSIAFGLWLLGALARSIFEARRSLQLTLATADATPAAAGVVARVGALAREMRITPPSVFISPGAIMVTGMIHSRLYLNEAVLTSSALDQIIRHELAHMRRRDVAALSFARLLGVALWFNPIFFAVEARRRLAAELDCDRQALAGGSREGARSYARALLHASRSNSGSSAVVGFGVAPRKALEMRMTSVLTPSPKPQKAMLGLRVCALGLAAALFGGVQAANASGELSPPDFTAIILEGRDTVGFGPHHMNGSAAPRFHGGHDIAAALGSPVRAPAAGRITYAGNEYNGNAAWGYVVEIDHGRGWTTVFAHLSGSMYGRGDVLEAGQIFATVGLTGLTTGPHLHVEVHENGERRDPAEYLPGLARRTD